MRVNENNYILRATTVALESTFDNHGYEQCIVHERNRKLLVNKTPLQIVEDSFSFLVYDYKGANKGARDLLNKRNQVPFMYSLNLEMVIIPCKKPERGEIFLVNKHIKGFERLGKNYTKVLLSTGDVLTIDMKHKLFGDKRVASSHLLVSMLERHKEIENEERYYFYEKNQGISKVDEHTYKENIKLIKEIDSKDKNEK